MAITTTRHESTQFSATLSVRVPQNAEGDLITAAQRRLSSIDVVEDAQVTGFEAIDPCLSATVVTVTATIETAVSTTELRNSLTDTVAIQNVADLEPAQPVA